MARKMLTDEQRSKVYGDKVMEKIGKRAISWAIEDIVHSGYRRSDPSYRGPKNRDSSYSGIVRDRNGHYQSVHLTSIRNVNKGLTLDEQRQVFQDIERKVKREDVSIAVEKKIEERRATRRAWGSKKRRKYTTEEEIVLDSASEQGAKPRDIKKGRIDFGKLSVEAKYILAKRALATEIGKLDEALAEKDARREEAKRLEAMRRHEQELRWERDAEEKQRDEERRRDRLIYGPQRGDDD